MLRGQIDRADREVVEGWAQDTSNPKAPVRLVVTADGKPFAAVLADLYRKDLETAGVGSGRHSFSLALVARLPPGPVVLHIHRADEGTELKGSPVHLDAEPGWEAPPLVAPQTLDGSLDIANRTLIEGWARDLRTPDQPVSLVVSVNGKPVARVLANAHRADLEEAGYGTGRHAFSVKLSNVSPLEACLLRIQLEGDDADVPGSPVVLEAARGFDKEAQDGVAALIGDVVSDADLKQRLVFLAQQMERLLQLGADRASQRTERAWQRQLKWRWDGGAGEAPQALAPRVLVIDDRVPAHDRDAGSHAIVSHMRALQRLGYEVSFAPSDMQAAAGAAALEAMDITCCYAPWTSTVEEVLKRQSDGFDVVYLHRFSNTRYVPLIRALMPSAWLIFSVADLMHLRLARQAKVEDRPELEQYSARLRAAEFGAARAANAVVTHSTHEAALLRAELPARKVHVVPWSVPAAPVLAPFAARRGLAFIGGYGHTPNVDAAHYLMLEIMPLVWREDPTMMCTLAGSDMPASLRAYAGPLVVAAGHVSDLARLFNTVRLTVAPLTYGAGVKGKVLESLAAGVPCVCSPVAAEGLALPALLLAHVAATAEAFAAMILRLHGDAVLNGATAQAGQTYVATHHGDAEVDAALLASLGGARAASGQAPASATQSVSAPYSTASDQVSRLGR